MADAYLTSKGRHVVGLTGEGFCFLQSVLAGLQVDHDERLTLRHAVNVVMNYLVDQTDNYAAFFEEGSDLVQEAFKFFYTRNFDVSFVDILVPLVAQALKVNIKIYQRNDKKLQRLTIPCEDTTRFICLKFNRSEQHPMTNHYEAVVRKPSVIGPDEQDIAITFDQWRAVYDHRCGTAGETIWKKTTADQDDCVMTGFEAGGDMSEDEGEGGAGEAEGEEEAERGLEGGAEIEDEGEEPVQRFGKARSYEEIVVPGTKSTAMPEIFRDDISIREVDFMPANIDGDVSYLIRNVSRDTFNVQIADRRHFHMKLSSTKDQKAGDRRRTGICRGNFCCYNPDCSFLRQTKGEANRISFKNHGLRLVKSCTYCGRIARREGCGARKIAEYRDDLKQAIVHHFGTHRCKLLPPTKQRKKEILRRLEEAGQKNPLMSARQFVHGQITEKMVKDDMRGARRDARLFADNTFNQRCFAEARADSDRVRDKHSFDAVATFKANKADKEDPFYVYRVHNGMGDGGEDYVFKSSRVAAQIMVDMDMDGEDNCLKGAVAFIDGAHSHCDGFISFVLWVYHPMMGRMLRLALMDIRAESTNALVIFWQVCNTMLQQHTGDKTYKFNPGFFYSDQAPANIRAIKEVFGEEVSANRLATCTWHFSYRMREHLRRITDDEEKKIARAHITSMTLVLTGSEFEKHYRAMKPFLDRDKKFASAIKYWYDRRTMVFPAFRDRLLPRSNLAEPGNRTMSKKKKMLVEATMEDTTAMLLQDEHYMGWLRQDMALKKRRGPLENVIASRARMKQNQLADEVCRTTVPLKEALRQVVGDVQLAPPENPPPDFEEPDASQEVLPSQEPEASQASMVVSDDEDPFAAMTVTAPRRKAAPSKTSNARRNTPKRKTPTTTPSKTPKRKRASQARTQSSQPSQVGPQFAMNPLEILKTQVETAEDVLGMKVVFSTQPTGSSPRPDRPVLFRIKRKGQIKTCAGKCKKTLDTTKDAPFDLCLRRKTGRTWKAADGTMMSSQEGYSYYHLDFACVKRHDETQEKRFLYVDDDTFFGLTKEHFEELKSKDLLTYVIAAKK